MPSILEIAFAVPPFIMQEIMSISLEVKLPPFGLIKVALLDKKHSSTTYNPEITQILFYHKLGREK
jgi:hypothetical protein